MVTELKLSVLDHSHISEGRTVADALAESVGLAQHAEQLGYGRYWVSEHHGSAALASSSPEVLIAHVAAHTRTIRVGSGGVMLPHYSAYKVAENFRLLEALHPGRIDAGFGRAPGGMPIATRALQENKHSDVSKYPRQIEDLIAYLHDDLPEDHPFARLRAHPQIPTAPDVWLLGSSDESARIAADKGTSYAFAQFFGVGGEDAIHHYQARFRPSPYQHKPRALAAVMVICADSDEEARRLAMSSELFFVRLLGGMELPFLPSVETAEQYPYSEIEIDTIRHGRNRRFFGSPARVKEELLQLAETLHLEELMVVTPIHDYSARLKSYELLAKVFGLTPTGP